MVIDSGEFTTMQHYITSITRIRQFAVRYRKKSIAEVWSDSDIIHDMIFQRAENPLFTPTQKAYFNQAVLQDPQIGNSFPIFLSWWSTEFLINFPMADPATRAYKAHAKIKDVKESTSTPRMPKMDLKKESLHTDHTIASKNFKPDFTEKEKQEYRKTHKPPKLCTRCPDHIPVSKRDHWSQDCPNHQRKFSSSSSWQKPLDNKSSPTISKSQHVFHRDSNTKFIAQSFEEDILDESDFYN
jgi:hypothetical protein